MLPGGMRAELLYLTMGIIESIWITPFFMLIVPGLRALPGYQSALLVAANLVGSLLVIRLLTRQQAADLAIQGLVLAGSVASIYLTLRYFLPLDAVELQGFVMGGKTVIPPVLLVIGGIGLLWFRGSRLATITVTVTRASFALRLGIVCLLFGALIPDARTQRAVLLLLPLFFFFGLIGTALARSASLRLNREVYESTFGASWVALIFSIGGTLAVFGFVASLAIGGFRFDSILTILGNLAITLVTVGAYLLSPLIDLFRRLAEFFFQNIRPNGEPVNTNDALIRRLTDQAGTSQNALQDVLNALPMVCASLLLIGLFAIILIRLRTRRKLMLRDGEEREQIDSDGLLTELLGAFGRGLQSLGDSLAALNPLHGRDALTTLTIRRLYARLVAQTAKIGTARAIYQTPYEFQPLIVQTYPAFAREIAELTRAYVEVHYGELPDDPGLVDRARIAIEQIEKIEAVKAS